MTQSKGPPKTLLTTSTSDSPPLEPDRQIQDDLGNWGVPPVEPRKAEDYFPNDAPINDEDVPPTKQEQRD